MEIKNLFKVLILVAITFISFSCASTEYNTQKGAAIGAVVGGIAGQAIGNNTAGTLIGAAGGTLAGAIAGNAMDQKEANKKIENMQRKSILAISSSSQEQPPGQWVEVPGEWIGGKWIPAHRAWIPINPGDTSNR